MGFLRHGQEGLNKLREVVIGALRLPPRALLMPPTPPIPFPSPFVSIFFNFYIIYLGRTHIIASVKYKNMGQANNNFKFWFSRAYCLSKIDLFNLDCRIIDFRVPV